MLGNYHTNQRSVKIQLMRKFLDNATIITLAQTDQTLFEHSEILADLFHTHVRGTADATLAFSIPNDMISITLKLPSMTVQPSLHFLCSSLIHSCPPYRRKSFTSDDIRYLYTSYSNFIPGLEGTIPCMYEEFDVLDFRGERIGSSKSRLTRSSHIG